MSDATPTPAQATPPAHPSFFACIEAKAAHLAATVGAFAVKMSPATVATITHAGEAEIAALCPELAQYMPQIVQVLSNLPLLQQLAAELQIVADIPVQPTAQTTKASA